MQCISDADQEEEDDDSADDAGVVVNDNAGSPEDDEQGQHQGEIDAVSEESTSRDGAAKYEELQHFNFGSSSVLSINHVNHPTFIVLSLHDSAALVVPIVACMCFPPTGSSQWRWRWWWWWWLLKKQATTVQ